MDPTLLLAASGPPNLDVWSLVMQTGPVGKAVLVILVGFSIASWAIMAERYRRFSRVAKETNQFIKRFNEGGGLAAIGDDTASLKWSPLAHIFRTGFREISLNPPPEGGVLRGDSLEAAGRVLRKSALVHQTDLESSLGFLATTASATPFIGLFGTVWGIMNAFRGIGVSGTASLAAYAPGIAEALVATAFGLGAAIPATIGYNYFLDRMRGIDAQMDEFIADFIHRLQGRRS